MHFSVTPSAVSVLAVFWPLCVAGLRANETAGDPQERKARAFVPAELERVQNFDDVRSLAKHGASLPFAGRPRSPDMLASLTYEQYREISYRPDEAIWWDSQSPFWIETFHQGYVQRDEVSLFLMNDSGTERVDFSPQRFNYGSTNLRKQIPSDAGHAGIKICGRFPGLSDGQEMLTFLGSSYFRSHSETTIYGASARGLAIDIGMKKDEEFPFFRSFWIERPGTEDETLTILALMDSPSVCGAYQFVFRPGTTESTVDVRASLYFRNSSAKTGIAPLTSMWIWGDGLDGPPKDSRPSVHDSDGLLIRTGEQAWTWRTFARQDYPSLSRFPVEQLHGFGLLQRNRSFFHYDDHNARYDLRPSVYVTPNDPWSGGRLELLEIPGAHEGIDNLAVYYVPEASPTAGQPIELDYQVAFLAGDIAAHSVVARATNMSLERHKDEKIIEVEVRFAGPNISEVQSANEISVHCNAIRGEITGRSIRRTPTGDWLASVTFKPTEDAPIELTMTLHKRNGGEALSETFSYLCPPKKPTFDYPDVYTRIESDPDSEKESVAGGSR